MSDVPCPRLSIDPARPFRVLQLTDFHHDGPEPLVQKTYDAIRTITALTSPDFLAVTGDIWCSDAAPELARARRDRDIEFLGGLGRPWAFTWGNHDYVTHFAEDMAAIAAAPNACMHGHDPRGNIRIELAAPGETVPRWDLFFVNSGPYWDLPEALHWFAREARQAADVRGAVVPAILYFHIPLKNYQDAINDGRFRGIALEEVLFWGDEDGLAETVIKAAGNVRACFCGHSHRNDGWFEEDGVVFSYGRCTGLAGYGDDLPRGATLLSLDPSGERFAFQTVFPDGSTWEAE